jgi:MFS family permease
MRGTRLAITFFFLADGLLLGSWAARIPAVQRQADISNPELGLALFAMSLGALVSMPLVGWLGGRIGSRRITVAALIGGSAALVTVSFASGLAGLAAGLLLFGAAFGAINVAANAQGVALERRYGRSILSSFHAAFSVGGLAGAGFGAVVAGLDVGTRAHFAALGLALGMGALVGGRWLLPAEPDGQAAAPHPGRPRLPRPLLVLGVAAFFTLLAEGAAVDWSAVYLSQSLGTTAAVAALGYTGFSLAMAASRMIGDRLNGRFGPAALARGGGLLAACGLALALVVTSTPSAIVGLAAMGGGLGVVVPVLFRAAASTPGVPAGAGLATVSTIGWLGFLAGPAVIGFVAGTVGLRAALGIVVGASVIVAFLARYASPAGDGALQHDAFEPRSRFEPDGVLVDDEIGDALGVRALPGSHELAA